MLMDIFKSYFSREHITTYVEIVYIICLCIHFECLDFHTQGVSTYYMCLYVIYSRLYVHVHADESLLSTM